MHKLLPLDRHISPARRLLAAAAGLLVLLALVPAQAADKTSLPVPRFVTLRSDKVNVRTGPGEQYPIDWVFTRKDMPVVTEPAFRIALVPPIRAASLLDIS